MIMTLVTLETGDATKIIIITLWSPHHSVDNQNQVEFPRRHWNVIVTIQPHHFGSAFRHGPNGRHQSIIGHGCIEIMAPHYQDSKTFDAQRQRTHQEVDILGEKVVVINNIIA